MRSLWMPQAKFVWMTGFAIHKGNTRRKTVKPGDNESTELFFA